MRWSEVGMRVYVGGGQWAEVDPRSGTVAGTDLTDYYTLSGGGGLRQVKWEAVVEAISAYKQRLIRRYERRARHEARKEVPAPSPQTCFTNIYINEACCHRERPAVPRDEAAPLPPAESPPRPPRPPSDTSSRSTCTLYLSESDVLLFHRYFSRRAPGLVDVDRLLEDQEYMSTVLMGWNPLVHVKRVNLDRLRRKILYKQRLSKMRELDDSDYEPDILEDRDVAQSDRNKKKTIKSRGLDDRDNKRNKKMRELDDSSESSYEPDILEDRDVAQSDRNKKKTIKSRGLDDRDNKRNKKMRELDDSSESSYEPDILEDRDVAQSDRNKKKTIKSRGLDDRDNKRNKKMRELDDSSESSYEPDILEDRDVAQSDRNKKKTIKSRGLDDRDNKRNKKMRELDDSSESSYEPDILEDRDVAQSDRNKKKTMKSRGLDDRDNKRNKQRLSKMRELDDSDYEPDTLENGDVAQSDRNKKTVKSRSIYDRDNMKNLRLLKKRKSSDNVSGLKEPVRTSPRKRARLMEDSESSYSTENDSLTLKQFAASLGLKEKPDKQETVRVEVVRATRTSSQMRKQTAGLEDRPGKKETDKEVVRATRTADLELKERSDKINTDKEETVRATRMSSQTRKQFSASLEVEDRSGKKETDREEVVRATRTADLEFKKSQKRDIDKEDTVRATRTSLQMRKRTAGLEDRPGKKETDREKVVRATRTANIELKERSGKKDTDMEETVRATRTSSQTSGRTNTNEKISTKVGVDVNRPPETERRRERDTESELQKNTRNRVVASDAGRQTARRERPGTDSMQKPRKLKCRPPIQREYSSLEDHCIVSLVSAGERARRVSGNQLWRELQEPHRRVSGVARTWQSLRNRYLRYILPNLPALHLDLALQSALRAGAARGEIRRKPASRPSILNREEQLPSASAHLARKKILEDWSRSPSPAEVPAEVPAVRSSPRRLAPGPGPQTRSPTRATTGGGGGGGGEETVRRRRPLYNHRQ